MYYIQRMSWITVLTQGCVYPPLLEAIGLLMMDGLYLVSVKLRRAGKQRRQRLHWKWHHSHLEFRQVEAWIVLNVSV